MKEAGNNGRKKPRLCACIPAVLMILCLLLTARASAQQPAESPAGCDYYALLIGQTGTEEGTQSLETAVRRDLRSMEEMLQGMATPYRIRSIVNPSREKLAEEIGTAFREAGAEDVCLLYYGGHGRYSAAESRRGVMTDAEGAWISAEELLALMDEMSATKIIILDSCYAGMLIRNLNNRSNGSQDKEDYFILAAAGEEEEAKNGGQGENQYGWFTWSLLYGSGYDERTGKTTPAMPADRDGDGAVSLKEALQYTRAIMSGVSTDQHPEMYPAEGNLILWSR